MSLEIIGSHFGLLVAIEEVERHIKPSGQKERMFLCKCSCGGSITARLRTLKIGYPASCGCIRRETVVAKNTKHGMSYTKFRSIHNNILRRCFNPKDEFFKDYGGRGINICVKWKTLTGFIEDMLPSYVDGLSIERIDVNGNYEPNNCKWIPMEKQALNKRNSLIFSHNGITQCLSEWARYYKLPYHKLWKRIQKSGYSFEQAINF